MRSGSRFLISLFSWVLFPDCCNSFSIYLTNVFINGLRMMRERTLDLSEKLICTVHYRHFEEVLCCQTLLLVC